MSSIRYRRNIDCLSDDQLHDLREALAELYTLPESTEHSYARIAGLHGEPSPHYCIHGYPGFLTWHRAYMEAFEKALQKINCDIMLPFWDWSSGPSTGLPDACSSPTYTNRSGDEVDNPLYSGPIAASAGGGNTARGGSVDSATFDDVAESAQAALEATSFSSFQSQINSPHGTVHVRVGGQMSSVSYAGFDPIFYLHHCNVDRLFANWQNTHSESLPSDEADLELEPFNKTFGSGWRTGSEFESTDALGYRYLNFCFFLPPFFLDDFVIAKIREPWLTRFRAGLLRMRSDRMEMESGEIRVFINDPKADEKTRTIGNPNFAGSFGLFGMGKKSKMVARGNNFDLELDITRHLKRLQREDDEIGFKLVAVNPKGKAIAPEKLHFKGVELALE